METMDWADDAKPMEDSIVDRRQNRRYALNLEVRWKLIRRRRVLDSGVGHTVNLSSGGILFEGGRQLPLGLKVELSISWPVLLRNLAPMQMLVSGKVVRCTQERAAVVMAQHEFRTLGTSAESRSWPTGTPHTPSAMFSDRVRMTAFQKSR